jgi:hypothetical protein
MDKWLASTALLLCAGPAFAQGVEPGATPFRYKYPDAYFDYGGIMLPSTVPGGSKGIGTINAHCYYIDGVPFVPSGGGGGGGGGGGSPFPFPALPQFGTAIGDGTDATTAITAAEASASNQIYVPAGTYPTTTSYVFKKYYGLGQIKTGGTGGHKQAPNASIISAAPAQSANDNDINQMFDGDYSKTMSAESMLVTGASVYGTPSTYTYLPEATGHIFLYRNGAGSGYNSTLNNQGPGRTGENAYWVIGQQEGQGDLTAYFTTCHVASVKASATNWLAQPACVLFGGQAAVDASSVGGNAQAGEVHLTDAGQEAQLSGWTIDLQRTSAANTLGVYDWGYRAQTSTGTVAGDAAFNVAGKWNTGFDTTAATLTNQSAVSIARNQRIYYDGVAGVGAAGFALGLTSPGTTYDTFDGTTFSRAVGGNPTLQLTNAAATIAGSLYTSGTVNASKASIGATGLSGMPSDYYGTTTPPVFVQMGTAGAPDSSQTPALVVQKIGNNAAAGTPTAAYFSYRKKSSATNTSAYAGYFETNDDVGGSGTFSEGIDARCYVNAPGGSCGNSFVTGNTTDTFTNLIADEGFLYYNNMGAGVNAPVFASFNNNHFVGSYVASNVGPLIADTGFVTNGNNVGYQTGFLAIGSGYSRASGTGVHDTAFATLGAMNVGINLSQSTFAGFQIYGTNFYVGPTGTLGANAYYAAGTAGVSCSGAPSGAFSSVGGIVTHC